MDDEPDEASDGGELLRALDEDSRGNYKRVLLLRFLRDQAKAVGHLTAAEADAEVDSRDGSGGRDEGYQDDYLAAALQGADMTEARSLNVQQLHQRRLQLSGGGGNGSAPPRRRSVSRGMECAGGGGDDGDDADKSCSPVTTPRRSRLRSEPTPSLLTPEVMRLTRGSARTFAMAAARAGVDTRGVDQCGATAEAMATATSRTSVDLRAPISGQLLGGRKRYGAASPPTGERWIAAPSATVAEGGGGGGYREAEETPTTQARSSLVRLPALFKQPGVARRALDCSGAALFAGLNKAA